MGQRDEHQRKEPLDCQQQQQEEEWLKCQRGEASSSSASGQLGCQSDKHQPSTDQVNVVDSSPVRPARRRILDDLVVRRLWWLSPLRPDEDESDYESTSSSSSSRSVWDGTNSSVAESTVASIGSIMTSAWLLRAVGLPDLDPRPARRSDLHRWTSRRLEMFHFQVSDDDIDYVQFTSASETSSSTSAATMRTSTAESSLEAAIQGSEPSTPRSGTGTEEDM